MFSGTRSIHSRPRPRRAQAGRQALRDSGDGGADSAFQERLDRDVELLMAEVAFFPPSRDPGFMLGALGCPKQPADDRLVATAAAQLSDTCHRTRMAEAYLVVCLKHAPLHQAELTEWRYEMPAATTRSGWWGGELTIIHILSCTVELELDLELEPESEPEPTCLFEQHAQCAYDCDCYGFAADSHRVRGCKTSHWVRLVRL